MKLQTAVAATVATLVLAGCGGGSANPSTQAPAGSGASSTAPAEAFKTDAQAENYVRGLKSWAGIDLTGDHYRDATCNNGYYSKTEDRTGHLPNDTGDKTNAAGESLFPSFQCNLGFDNRSFALYVVPKPDGTWTLTADR